MAAPSRFVDSVPAPKKTDTLQVINLGLSRTSTMSFRDAMGILGYRSYHMSQACEEVANSSLKMWNEAVLAKYGPSPSSKSATNSNIKPYGKEEFAKLYQDYTAATDIPTVLFLPELLKAYPNAKLILTTHPRGVEGWLKSVRNSFFRVVSWGVWDWILVPFDKFFSAEYVPFIRRVVELWTDGTPWETARHFDESVQSKLRAFYRRHNETVLQLAREQGREVLEFDPRQGWEPLCKFLGKDVPKDKGYPHVNEGDVVVNIHKFVVGLRLSALLAKPAAVVLGALAVFAAWRWKRDLQHWWSYAGQKLMKSS